MKKLYLAFIFPLLFIFGCTQYNGHIGPIFGSWALMEISKDGVPLEMKDETVFSFQNEIVKVTKLATPPFSETYRYGNFSISDDILTLKFQKEPTDKDSNLFLTPTWLFFPEDGNPIPFDIKKLDGGKMELDMISDSERYTYKFKKTW